MIIPGFSGLEPGTRNSGRNPSRISVSFAGYPDIRSSIDEIVDILCNVNYIVLI